MNELLMPNVNVIKQVSVHTSREVHFDVLHYYLHFDTPVTLSQVMYLTVVPRGSWLKVNRYVHTLNSSLESVCYITHMCRVILDTCENIFEKGNYWVCL